MKVYDISAPMRIRMPVWPGDEHFMHSLTSSIKEGDRANVSIIHCSSHTGAHVDAPFHFLQLGKTLDQIDISRMVGTAQVLKVDCFDDITADDLESARRDGRIFTEIKRILFKTKNTDRRLMRATEFHKDYVAIGSSAAEWLVQNQYITVGADGSPARVFLLPPFETIK